MTFKSFPTTVALLAMAGALGAQVPKADAVLMAIGANSKQSMTYQWKQKTTVIRKGVPAAVRVDEIRFDATGKPQRLMLSQPEEKRMGPLRAKKAAEIKDDVEQVMQLAGRYANPQEIGRAIRKGEAWEGPGTLRIQSRYVILPSDEMTAVVNTATYLPSRIDFKTQFEGAPITVAIDYQQFPNGPSMMTRMTVQIPKDDITVTVESFDFVRLAASVVP